MYYSLSELLDSDSWTRITRGITVLRFSDKLSLSYHPAKSMSFITREVPPVY